MVTPFDIGVGTRWQFPGNGVETPTNYAGRRPEDLLIVSSWSETRTLVL